ncbi:hypothetical protein [Cupriavidus plantarum]|uniref:Dynamin family protein n=1 Tax=Cupriavidus plantarum TaxID=942865 RepID=A0A316F2A8_9BURK|nr:hypothetical protein [Cupriavidus plantarum]PWK37673.1 hypothetical protein C7419_1011556 [Cupriavidus plantarum]
MSNRKKIPGQNLHQAVLSEIDRLLSRFTSDKKDDRLNEAVRQVTNIIGPAQAELVQSIETLEKHARRNPFTIAFYGETNAGKSIIIDTLRILLGEPTRQQARRQFKAIAAKYGIDEATLSDLEQSIDEQRASLEAMRAQTEERAAQRSSRKHTREQKLLQLREDVDARLRTATVWKKLLHLVRKSPDELELDNAEQHHAQLLVSNADEHREDQASLERAADSLRATEEHLAAAQEELPRLDPYADGDIIGQGLSDFTLECHSYLFEANGQRFELLDVPGIEGKEARVLESILGAVRTAHAVFYITNKAAVPQTGDRKGQGTLEKISAHLGDHTEVWAIYNKRINSTIPLDSDALLNDDDRDGLSSLDHAMKEHLGPQYQGHISLSAQPAFLAVADYLVPGSDRARKRAKFLKKWDAQTVLSKSRFQAFIKQLTGSMLEDCEARIRAANARKVQHAVEAIIGKLAQLQKETIGPLAEEFRNDWKHVDKQLDLAVEGLDQAVKSVALQAAERFKQQVRVQVYQRIEGDIGNDALKTALKTIVGTEQAALETQLSKQMKEKVDAFRTEVAETIERFSQRMVSLLDIYQSKGAGAQFDLNWTFDFRSKSGVDYTKLLVAGAALVVGIMAGGPVAIGLAVATFLVSAGMAVRSLFDSKYKKAQQRLAADKNIERVIDSLRRAMEGNRSTLMDSVEVQIESIKTQLRQSVDAAIEVNSALKDACRNLKRYSETISETEDILI